MSSTIQPMPDLTVEQLDALRADIAAHGVLVPVVVDQHGRILDGNNRAAIATELGLDYPTTVVDVADDDEAEDVAVTLNCARRHLTQEQKRDLITRELRRRWSDSDRAVARRVGCSPTTVGTVRASLVAEAEKRTEEIRTYIAQAREGLVVDAVIRHRGIDGPALSWQAVGDVLERTYFADVLSNLDSEIEQHMREMFGGWFDEIRAWALDCDEGCPTCTPEDRAWAEQHPAQVWRHREPVGGESR